MKRVLLQFLMRRTAMRGYGESVQCMDCPREFTGHFDNDSEIILCPKCSVEFEDYVAGDESRSYGLRWWKEFIDVHGRRLERERRERFRLVDEVLASCV